MSKTPVWMLMHRIEQDWKQKARSDLAKGQRNRCFYCAAHVHPNQRVLEHKTPICRGGTNDRDNLVMACRTCDVHKGPLTEAEFMPVRLNHEERRELIRKTHARLQIEACTEVLSA